MTEKIPVEHRIDKENKLIITSWRGVATDKAFTTALLNYHQNIKSNPDYQTYDELLDFRAISEYNLTTKGLIELGKIAQRSDRPDIKTKLAILVASNMAYGLSSIYISYRMLLPDNNKKLKAFKSLEEALSWLTDNKTTL